MRIKNNYIKKLIGEVLIASSIALLLFIYQPIIQLYLFPVSIAQKDVKSGFYMEIPKIGLKSPIIAAVDPFNTTIYRQALEKGIAQAKGTALPGQKGTIFLFGHSSGPPWEIVRYNTVFLRIGELERGDMITIFRNGQKYQYKVVNKKTVQPDQTQYLKNSQGDMLILQTCTPIGTDWQRLLVFATPTNTK